MSRLAVKQDFIRIYYEDLESSAGYSNRPVRYSEIVLLTFKNFPEASCAARSKLLRRFVERAKVHFLIINASLVYICWAKDDMELYKRRVFELPDGHSKSASVRKLLIRSYIEHATAIF